MLKEQTLIMRILLLPRLPHITMPFLHIPNQEQDSSGQSNGIPAMEFLVSLGASGWGNDPVTNHDVGSIDQQEGTFMHELGHNLNLGHGGDDGINCKPNYLSIMSYSRQMSSLILNRPLDYSSSEIKPLYEYSLNEPNGIGASNPIGLDTAVGPFPPSIIPTGTPVDWNRDGNSLDVAVIADINNIRQTGDCKKSTPDENTWFDGYNDWANLMYVYSPPCNFCALVGTTMVNKSDNTVELTTDEIIDDRISLYGRIENTLKSLPASAFRNPEVALYLKGNLSVPLRNEIIKLENVLRTDNVDLAIAMLNLLKSTTDSSIGGNAEDDLITNADAQRKVLPEIESSYLSPREAEMMILGKIRASYAEEFEHANPQDIVNICFNPYRKHWKP